MFVASEAARMGIGGERARAGDGDGFLRRDV